jgi:hypothetical protein
MLPGNSVTFTATGTVLYGTVGPITNTATVVTPMHDAAPGNNVSTVSTPVEAGFGAVNFYTLTPCRVFDTREASGPTLGAPLSCGIGRTFAVAGSCGVPSGAKAVSLNLTGTASTSQGNLRLFPTGAPTPLASTLNYAAGLTRANNAVIALGTDGQISVLCSPSGATHVILDVNGYFE